MYYILTVNPAILAQAGVPRSAALLSTFAVIILGNISGMLWTRTGLMIAPAIGMSSFFASYIASVNDPAIFNWRFGLLGCFLAGVAVLILSLDASNWRQRIIDDMPPSVRKGASAAIGALLVKQSFDLFRDCVRDELDPILGVVFVATGVGIIILFFLLRNRYAHHHLLSLIFRSEFILVVGLLSAGLHWFAPEYVANLPQTSYFTFLWSEPGALSLASDPAQPGNRMATVALTLVFAAIIWFIVVTDIPGTPREVLPAEIADTHERRAVWGGFVNDGIWAALSPVFGTTPTIYYAENNILRDFGVYSWRVGCWATLLFSASFLVVRLLHVSVEWLIPPFATVPIILYIGIFIISTSFMQKSAAAAADSPQPVGIDEGAGSLEYHIPTAMAAILTPRIGLEYSFPLSVISYWLVWGRRSQRQWTFKLLSWGSAAALMVLFLNFYWTPPDTQNINFEERKWQGSFDVNRRPIFESMLSSSFVLHYAGRDINRNQFLSMLGSANAPLRALDVQQRENVSTRGDTAVVEEVWTIEGPSPRPEKHHAVCVWTREPGGWKVLSLTLEGR